MKGLISKIAVEVMIILTISIGAIHAADLKDGFLGLDWRTDLSASPDFVKIDEQEKFSSPQNDIICEPTLSKSPDSDKETG